jgi:hypothetical protein
MQGSSVFSSLDFVGDLSSLEATGIGLQSPSLASVPLPGVVADYVVRAYSGGINDPSEFSNVFSNVYGDSWQWWLQALGNNITHSGLQAIEPVASLLPGDTAKCAFSAVSNTASVIDGLGQYGESNFSTTQGFQFVFETEVNSFIDSFHSSAEKCGLDNPLAALLNVGSGLGKWINKGGPVITAFAVGADVGESAQRLGELLSASPVETAIISLRQSASGGPVITGLSPVQIIALIGNQPAEFVGTGFSTSGARVFWKTPSGLTQGPDIPTFSSASAITVLKNFGNEMGPWQAQIVNSDGTKSNWWPFQVMAGTGAKPDLV